MRRFAVVVVAACAPFGCMAIVDFDGYHRTGIGDAGRGDVVFVPVDAPPPTHEPTSIAFRDENPLERKVAGTVTIGRATDESDVTGYSIWFVNGDTKTDHVTTLPPPADPSAPLTYAIPPDFPLSEGAKRLRVVTVRGDIEMATGPTLDDADNFPRVVAIAGAPDGPGPSTSTCSGNGCYPAAIVDPKTSKLLVVTRDGSYNQPRTALFRCNIDGTSCARQDLTDATPTEFAAHLAIDTMRGELLASIGVGGGNWGVYRCAPGGTTCAPLSAPSPPSGGAPTVLYDGTNDRVLVVVQGQFGDPSVATCSPDVSQCTSNDIDSQHPILGVDATIDTKNQQLVVASHEIQHGLAGVDKGYIDLWTCGLDGTNCSYHLLPVGMGILSKYVNTVAVDTSSNRLLFVTDMFVAYCDPTGANCGTTFPFASYVDSGALGWSQGLVDKTRRKLWLLFTAGDAATLHVARCELDGTQCVPFEFPIAKVPTPTNASAVLDPTDDRILIAWQNDSDADRPFLTWFHTW